MKKIWKSRIGSLKTLGGAIALVMALALLSASPARSAQILFMVSIAPPTTNVGDIAVRDYLTNTMGHTVTYKQANVALATNDTLGKALILVSSTVASNDVGDKFRNTAIPVMSWEGFIYDNMGMTGAPTTEYNSDASFLTVTIATPSHLIAAGQTGTPAFFSGTTAIGGNTWGIAGPGAVKIATLPTDANKSLVFAYEYDANLVPGTGIPAKAPGRRVGFGLGDATFSNTSANGKAIFAAAVNWAIGTAPAMTTQPANQSVTVGGTATFTAVASGTGKLSYQWRRNGTNVTTGTGGNTATYTTPATVIGDNGAVYTVVITNTTGTVTSSNATLTVTTGPVAPNITNPATTNFAVTATVGTAYTFNVAASGSPAPTFTASSNLPTGLSINQTTGSITGTPTTPTTSPATVTVTATNSVGNNSKTLIFTVNQAPALTNPPANNHPVSASVGVPFTFIAAATGNPAPIFSSPNLPGFLTINPTSGAITGMPTAAASHNFTVTATNGVGNPSSRTIALTVSTVIIAPSITAQPLAASAPLGAPATFTVTATGTPLSYQWKKDGVNVTSGTGGTTASYTTAATTVTDDNATYTCVISNTAGTVTTNGNSKLRVVTQAGKVVANDVAASRISATELVTAPQWEIPDYVFEKGYALRSLPDLEKYLDTHKHLPEVPAAAEIKGRGMDVGRMNVTMLKNLEELTLHVIALQKEMKAKDLRMERQLDSLRTLLKTGSR